MTTRIKQYVMSRYVVCILVTCLICFSCQTDVSKNKLIISTAASAQFVVRDLVRSFENKYDLSVDLVVGSSGKLTTQLINGAPFDVFISANTFYPNRLSEEGKIIDIPYVYGNGIPVVWSADTSLDLDNIKETLQSVQVKKIAIADPKTAPYGAQAKRYFRDIGIYNDIEHKIVYGESISQVNEYILSSAVQIGFSAMSVLSSDKLTGQGKYRPMNGAYHIPQAMVLIKNGRDNKSKKLFLRFVKSNEGKNILKKYGLL